MLTYTLNSSSLGFTCIGISNEKLAYLSFGKNKDILESILLQEFPTAQWGETISQNQLYKNIQEQLQGEKSLKTVPLELTGTEFQLEVWKLLQGIPAGETRSYSELAQRLGSIKYSRAVAKACASNRIAFFIPCHRVLRKDGTISGYRWGVEYKKQLLEQESKLGV